MSNAQRKETVAAQSTPQLPQKESMHGNGDKVRRNLKEYIRQPEFKALLEQLRFRQKAANVKTVAVLNGDAGDGKTSLVAALALGYANLFGEKVLVVDADYRRQGGAFTPEAALGMVDGPRVAGGVVRTLSEKVDVLCLRELTNHRGREAETEFARSGEILKENYGTVFVDSCCLFKCGTYDGCPGASARRGDGGAILIVSQKDQTLEWMKEAGERLQNCGFKVIGIVANEGGMG